MITTPRPHDGTIRPRRARRGGFTLVELLAAIFIVLLLSGMLLAVGAAMRRNSRRHVCLTAFEHVKDAQAIYFSRRGALVDETNMVSWDTSVTPRAATSTAWFVTVAAGPPRPLTTMEYFVLITRMGSSDAFAHLQLLGDLLVPSSEQNGPVIPATGRACYGTVRIYKTKADALANRDVQYILYDPTPGNPEVPTALAGKLDQTNTGPLQTLVGPWCQGDWDVAAWKTTVNPVLPSQPFQWRPHELDYRSSMANYDNTRVPPLRMWYANDALVPPYLPFSEGLMVASPGPDGLWAQMDGANAASVAPHGLTNRGIAPGAQPVPPFDAAPSLLDAGAKDNLYSSQRAQ